MLFSNQKGSVVRFALILALLGGMLGVIPVMAATAKTNSRNTIDKSYISQTDPAPVFTQVSTGSGSRYTCAVTVDGRVKCWGRNDTGQLGDGTTTQRTAPVDVLVSPGGAPLSGVSAIATGFDHACALMSSGQVKCWGVNYWGQLGDGTLNAHTTPVDVLSIPGGPPLIGVIAITSSSHHTCALMSTGGVKCWGQNMRGQLGNSTTNDATTPVNVLLVSGSGTPLLGVSSVTAGGDHTCALTTSGGVKCWGYNFDGQLGDNTTTQRANPIDVIGLSSGVSAVSAGYNHTCVVLTSGQVKCWGNNNNGQLGDGTTTLRRTPVSVLTAPAGPALSGISNVSAGGFVTCALTAVAGAKCWGGNASGNLGDGTLSMRYTAVDVLVAPGGAPLGDVSKVITYGHSCALTTSGGVKCWGNNSYGQLGDGTDINRYNPVDLTFKIPQTISINTPAPASASYGTSFTVLATTTSGLTVTYTASGACTNVGATFTMSSGTTTCTVTYEQAGDADYTFAPPLTSTVTAQRVPLTVTADAKNKTYGELDPVLTYQITSGALVGTDIFTGALSRAAGSNAGIYAISKNTLALNSNKYILTYVGASLTINKRPIAVTADAKTKIAGMSDPALTYQITSGALVTPDIFTGSLSRDPGETAGDYAIRQGNLSLSSNYDLTYTGANLTIASNGSTVTNTNDSGIGSLRQTIADAAPGDTIRFDPSLAGQTITLASDLVINKNLTIDGSGLSPQVTISGGSVAHLEIPLPLLYHMVTISNLTIVNGHSSEDGGAILSYGDLTVRNSTLRNNYAMGSGGGVASAGELTLENSTIEHNQADGFGGGISISANSTIMNSTLAQNQAGAGGAISFVGNGNGTITNTTFFQNHAVESGGAFYMSGNGIVDVSNSTIAGNNAPQGSELFTIGNSWISLYNSILICKPENSSCIYQSGALGIGNSNSIIGVGTLSDFGLAAPADNGGPTHTMALLPHSQLIDAGDNTYCPATDQRGISRPQGSACDIGAYEFQDSTRPAVVSFDPEDDELNVPVSTVVTITFSETLDPTTVNDASIFLIPFNSNTHISGSYSVADNVVTLIPNEPLAVGTTYLIQATNAVKDLAGNSLDQVWLSFFTTGPNGIADTTTADFGAGTSGACYISTIDNGEVNLSPLIGEEFSGNDLSAGWSQIPLSSGTTLIANGQISADGAMAYYSTSAFTAGHLLQFRGMFAAGQSQQVGLIGNPDFSGQWAVFSTSDTTDKLYARTSDGQSTLLDGNFIGMKHTYEIHWVSTTVFFMIDGLPAASHDVALTDLRPMLSDSNSDGQAVSIEWMHFTPYSSPCTFSSRVFDAGQVVNWLNLGWMTGGSRGTACIASLDPDEPPICTPNYGFTIETRTGNTSTPDGTWSDWQATNFSIAGPNGRYLQYRVTLSSDTPSATLRLYSVVATYLNLLPTPTLTFTPTNTPTPTTTSTPTATPTHSYNPLYLSLTGNQTIGGVASADEDILRFDGSTWSLFFDGSDVGVASPDLFGFSIVDADTILMSFSTAVTVNGLAITPQDVVRFEATSLGSTTAGTFSMYLDGSDVGLDTTAEKIDSVSLLPDGRVLISTTGNPAVVGITGGKDEDVLVFTPTSLGNVTGGSWAMYFDGSDVGLAETSGEDVDALDVVGGKIYLSTADNFSVNGVAGADEDVFVCEATSLGDVTACQYSSALYFDGSTWGLSANDVDAFHFLTIGPVPTATYTNTPSITPSPTFTTTPSPTPTRTPTSSNTPTPGSQLLPDLTIIEMRNELQNTSCFTPGDPFGVRVWIRNIGQAAAGSFVVNLNGAEQTINGLGIAETKAVFFPGASNPVTATVDSMNIVAESNENNNTHSETLPIPTAPLPCATPTFTPTPAATFTPTITNTPNASDLIFADDFESGNLSAWTSSTVDLGDLSVSNASALIGSQGLQAMIDDVNPIYLTDDSPTLEARYRTRFYFDPNSITMTSNDAHFIFKGFMGTATDVLQVEFRNSSGAYQIRAKLLNDSSAFVVTNWFTISDAPHFIELDWRAAVAAGANNGGLTLWIDGIQQADLTGIDNDTWRIDRARLGALSGMDVGTSGSYYFDAFESRRQNYIGP